MLATSRSSSQNSEKPSTGRSFKGTALVLALVISLLAGGGYVLFNGQGLPTTFLVPSPQQTASLTERQSNSGTMDVRLTREGIDRLLATLDDAVRRKDVDGVLRHISHDAMITIHLKQGPQQQTALLTRDDYRKTLAMAFAFPSNNDFTRTNTSVSLAADERSAKVSFKSTETLRPANHEFKAEGEETLLFTIRDGKPMISSLEQTFPGDST
ncbi:MAG: nuclear transport factor 2 family protein [Nitrospira sp.]|nr:nuclear transport factor 2 family protein [Nitrospira sp.]MBS0165240.1 nuclear transport factor 2 family protein [Nitrospira sp.]